MCKQFVTAYICGHRDVDNEICQRRGTGPRLPGASRSYDSCYSTELEATYSTEPCYYENCKWEDYDGVWKCCMCLMGPNRKGDCKWCNCRFCEKCTAWEPKAAVPSGPSGGFKGTGKRREKEKSKDK